MKVSKIARSRTVSYTCTASASTRISPCNDLCLRCIRPYHTASKPNCPVGPRSGHIWIASSTSNGGSSRSRNSAFLLDQRPNINILPNVHKQGKRSNRYRIPPASNPLVFSILTAIHCRLRYLFFPDSTSDWNQLINYSGKGWSYLTPRSVTSLYTVQH